MSKKETTDELLASRREIYGDRVQNMERTAALWSALLGIKIHDWQVPLMMSAYKMLRTFETPDYSDNSDDIDGWKKMFVEVMDANHGGIVQARTVEEYQRKKQYGDAWDVAADANQKPRHPYENAERDAEAEAVAAWDTRCSFYLSGQRCILREGHFGIEHKFLSINTRQRGE